MNLADEVLELVSQIREDIAFDGGNIETVEQAREQLKSNIIDWDSEDVDIAGIIHFIKNGVTVAIYNPQRKEIQIQK